MDELLPQQGLHSERPFSDKKGRNHQPPHFTDEERESQELGLPQTCATSLGQKQNYHL